MMRAVTDITDLRAGVPPGNPTPFSDFSGQANLILLGDPGAGKTHMFREAATAVTGKYVTARHFLVTPAVNLTGKPLFIDALDERRAGRGDSGTVDMIVEKLFEVAPPQVRISCREIDWLGQSDLAAFSPYFDQSGGVRVLRLERLTQEERFAVLLTETSDHAAAQQFLVEAQARSLDRFLENPQNLKMLWRAFKAGSWPENLTDLYNQATDLMLEEHNTEHARTGLGIFMSGELRHAAGAVCAAGLIGDIDAISATEQTGTALIPGYRSMRLCPNEKVLASLGRRIFNAPGDMETVYYAHRTTAEFLGAQFLAQQIRDGLPIGRVMALMGVDGKPASELRGLHAWLAIHLPEQSDILIKADPYGVLTYGDPAALPPSAVSLLLRSLASLSAENPMFRSENWQFESVGALARPEMVEDFRTILDDPTAEFGIRSIVLEALAYGQSLPALIPDLVKVLAAPSRPFAERQRAWEALYKMGADGLAAVQSAAANLDATGEDIRLRTNLIRQMYGQWYGPTDVIALLDDYLKTYEDENIVGGILWDLADEIPEQDLPLLLDQIAAPQTDEDPTNYEVGAFYARLLVRAWPTTASVTPARALMWLEKRHALKGGAGNSRATDLRAAMQLTPDRLEAFADHFFSSITNVDEAWREFHEFREFTFFAIPVITLIEAAASAMKNVSPADARYTLLYEMSLVLVYQLQDSQIPAAYDRVYDMADGNAALEEARDRRSKIILPDEYFAHRAKHAADGQRHRNETLAAFDAERESIRRANHLGWLGFIGRIYWGLYLSLDRDATPAKRLEDYFGPDRASIAEEAIKATLMRNALPTQNEILELAAQGQQYDWWMAFLAALDEYVLAGGDILSLPEEVLKAALTLALVMPLPHRSDGIESIHTPLWRSTLVTARPDLAQAAYLSVARSKLNNRAQFIDGLDELLTNPAFEAERPQFTLSMLTAFLDVEPYTLTRLLATAAASRTLQASLGKLTAERLAVPGKLSSEQADLWLAAAYLQSPQTYFDAVQKRVQNHPTFVFTLRDYIGALQQARPGATLPLDVLEALAQLVGTAYPAAAPPKGGWGGNNNPWDASDYFTSLISRISAVPTAAATTALETLQRSRALSTYRHLLARALEEQRKVRRDAEYDQPDWFQTIEALDNKAPATVADLRAVMEANFRDFAREVAHGNTDIFKMFWNIDSYSRPTGPRTEEACRDDLVTLLRPKCAPLGISLEPEAHMAGDKRADISAAMAGWKILCELKRDYHSELWSAIGGQLERFYAHDPESRGYGIYVAFWFGDDRPTPMPKPPAGLALPTSAQDLEDKLRATLSPEMVARLSVVVIDVSGKR